MTRTQDDQTVSLEDRVAMAKGEIEDNFQGVKPERPDGTFGVDLFLSIHCNSSPDTSAHGTSALIWDSDNDNPNPSQSTADFLFAKDIVNDYLEYTKTLYSGASTHEGQYGVVGRDSLLVLNGTHKKNDSGLPACCALLETEFMSNSTVLPYLEQTAVNGYQDYAGLGIKNGIYDLINAVQILPPLPLNLSGKVSSKDVILNWKTPDATFSSFRIYKNGGLIASPSDTSTSYDDQNATESLPAHYEITTVDESGNQSPSATFDVIGSPASITSETYWNALVFVDSNVTVQNGATLHITPGASVVFNAGHSYSLNVEGQLSIEGDADSRVAFTSNSASPSAGDWGSIVLNGSGANGSTINYADIEYGTDIQANNTSNVTIENCNITNSSYIGIDTYNSSNFLAQNDTIANSNVNHGIAFGSGSNDNCYNDVIYKTNQNQQGAGIQYGTSSGNVIQNDIDYYNWGIGAIWGSSVNSFWINNPGRNNRVTNCLFGLMIYRDSYCDFGAVSAQTDYSFNSIDANVNYNAAIGYSYPTYAGGLYADGDWWGSNPPDASKFYVASGS